MPDAAHVLFARKNPQTWLGVHIDVFQFVKKKQNKVVTPNMVRFACICFSLSNSKQAK